MYEVETNSARESIDQIPSSTHAAFAELQGRILARTVLPWSEHCTECAWPTCYKTCDLYAPREDARCRRFVDGMVRIDCPESVNGYLLKIRFKRWGKLWTPGFIRMKSIEDASDQERQDRRLGTVLYNFPLPAPVRRFAVTKRYSYKKRVATRGGPQDSIPTCFVVECMNPAETTVSLTLSLRSLKATPSIPFQQRIELAPGFTRVRIAYAAIANVVDLRQPFSLEIVPNETGEETTLYFGFMDFIEEVPSSLTVSDKVKCVVWDLDNTLWDGVLIEDGPERLRLKPGIVEVITALDERGILQSIASKNNADDAMEVLRRFQLGEYFLYPQISWSPKSTSIQSIAKLLNIGRDTLLFVDDSAFERGEVAAVCPDVETLDASEYLSIPDAKRCQVTVTEESKTRRMMYQVDQHRQEGAKTFHDDYEAFLKDCSIEIRLSPLMEENVERVHELTQRTNQMNFSGNRYDRAMLQQIRETAYLDTYVIACSDRFGSYGIVGFGVVDSREPRLTDLMFSCRIQAKHVEHAFLGHIIRKYRGTNSRDFHASYRKSPRNLPSGKVFDDIGMREQGVADGVTDLSLPKNAELPEDGVIRVIAEDAILIGTPQ